MRNNLAAGLDHIKEFEGHTSHDPRDPGGLTVWGIAWKRIGQTLGMTRDEFRNMTWKQAASIYDTRYFTRAGCDDWPAGIDLVVFDAAVNQGVKASVRFLQRAVKVKADGIIGPVTRTAVRNATKTDVRRRRVLVWFMVRRTLHYTALGQFSIYGTGWLRRTYTAMLRATELVIENERIVQ